MVAREWQAMVDDGQVASRKELAQTLGVSRARVSQMLQLLTLSPPVIDAIAHLGDPMPERIVSERSLRPLVRADRLEQERWINDILKAGLPGRRGAH